MVDAVEGWSRTVDREKQEARRWFVTAQGDGF